MRLANIGMHALSRHDGTNKIIVNLIGGYVAT